MSCPIGFWLPSLQSNSKEYVVVPRPPKLPLSSRGSVRRAFGEAPGRPQLGVLSAVGILNPEPRLCHGSWGPPPAPAPSEGGGCAERTPSGRAPNTLVARPTCDLDCESWQDIQHQGFPWAIHAAGAPSDVRAGERPTRPRALATDASSHWRLSPARLTAMEPPHLVNLIFLLSPQSPVLNAVFGISGRPHPALRLFALMSLTESSSPHREPIQCGFRTRDCVI